MKQKAIKIIAAVSVALFVVMAGLFAYEASGFNRQSSSYTSLQNAYNAQQKSVVLGEAYAHWDYIAIENSSLLSKQYTSNAELRWIGGPLTGNYTGSNNITGVWNKFFTLWSAVWYYTITPPTVSVSGDHASVTSQNQFVLTPFSNQTQVQYLNISYTMNFVKMNSSWLINLEIWHIVGSGFVSNTEAFTYTNYIENLAFSHWNNIAIENNTSVMLQYASNASLHWDHSTLNGYYNGTSAINTTWNKFFHLWSAVWFYSEAPPVIEIHGNVATVNATVQFVVQDSSNSSIFKYINVTYDLKYMNFGFDVHSGLPRYLIVNELFDVTGIGLLSKV